MTMSLPPSSPAPSGHARFRRTLGWGFVTLVTTVMSVTGAHAPLRLLLGIAAWLLPPLLACATWRAWRGHRALAPRPWQLLGAAVLLAGLASGEFLLHGTPVLGEWLTVGATPPAPYAALALLCLGIGAGVPLLAGRRWPELLEAVGTAVERPGDLLARNRERLARWREEHRAAVAHTAVVEPPFQAETAPMPPQAEPAPAPLDLDTLPMAAPRSVVPEPEEAAPPVAKARRIEPPAPRIVPSRTAPEPKTAAPPLPPLPAARDLPRLEMAQLLDNLQRAARRRPTRPASAAPTPPQSLPVIDPSEIRARLREIHGERVAPVQPVPPRAAAQQPVVIRHVRKPAPEAAKPQPATPATPAASTPLAPPASQPTPTTLAAAPARELPPARTLLPEAPTASVAMPTLAAALPTRPTATQAIAPRAFAPRAIQPGFDTSQIEVIDIAPLPDDLGPEVDDTPALSWPSLGVPDAAPIAPQPIAAPAPQAIEPTPVAPTPPTFAEDAPWLAPAAEALAPVAPAPRPEPRHYDDTILPPVALLRAADPQVAVAMSEEELLERSIVIEEKLAEFKVKVRVLDACAGPVITRYEVEPAVGVRGAQIVNLMKDLARALGLVSIRVVETIPGKTCMGLELPNPTRQMIRLSEIFSSAEFEEGQSRLTMALGKDITGKPIVTDLAKAPHLLVAGTTGSGKSVGVNAMILSLLYKATPDEVRFIMVDPKMLELSVYDGIPHLLAPVVTDMKLAANALNWCVAEMEKRYRLMSALGVRNLAGFNQKVKEAEKAGQKLTNPFTLTPDDPEPLSHLPFIVVVVDE
ncbi:DNA translocase FtsK, partial [Chitiniphilus shinanonensis]|uniref:DNA translocase FtsK n=2 Tax=Chitiniphilus shinanonensis TaxID=553088 RepID=UPI000A2F689C